MAFLEMVGITKRFPGVLANDGVDLAVERGEIHAVMGENGAGKSTLMAVLYGLLQPDAGYIRLDGRTVFFRSPIDAIAHGVGMVHQSFKLFDSLTVWENVVFGSEPRRGLFIDGAAARRQVSDLAERHGLPIDPDARVHDLAVGVRQRLEILKALYRQARILILDEPTAVLTPQEAQSLFAVMRRLAVDGCSILLVTHKLNEVMAVTDRITVMRDGRVTDRQVTAETNPGRIVQAMTGRNVLLEVAKSSASPGATALTIEDLSVEAEDGRAAVDGVSLTVRAGEILGVAGVAGNGQSELVEAIMGLRPARAGRIRLGERDLSGLPIAARRSAGIAYIAEDRARTASALAASARDNLAMGFHRAPPLARRGILDLRAMRDRARALIRKFDIRIASEATAVGTLSGGNLQKVVIARELSHRAPVLIAEQPTRGVDVGAIEFIHAELVRERDRGCAILLVSAELSEILALSDRIAVMYEGRCVALMDRSDASEAVLGLGMAGGVAKAA